MNCRRQLTTVTLSRSRDKPAFSWRVASSAHGPSSASSAGLGPSWLGQFVTTEHRPSLCSRHPRCASSSWLPRAAGRLQAPGASQCAAPWPIALAWRFAGFNLALAWSARCSQRRWSWTSFATVSAEHSLDGYCWRWLCVSTNAGRDEVPGSPSYAL